MLDKKNQDGPQEDLDDILKDFDEQDELHQRIQEFKKKKEASSAQQEELKERGQIQEEPEEAKTAIEQLKAMQEEKKETEELEQTKVSVIPRQEKAPEEEPAEDEANATVIISEDEMKRLVEEEERQKQDKKAEKKKKKKKSSVGAEVSEEEASRFNKIITIVIAAVVVIGIIIGIIIAVVSTGGDDGTDKSRLENLITQVEELDQNDYTEDEWTALQNALEEAKAVFDDEDATQDAVAWLVADEATRERLSTALRAVYDMERLSTRVSLNRATPQDFCSLRLSLAALPAVHAALSGPSEGFPVAENLEFGAVPVPVLRLLKTWDNLDDLASLLDKALVDNPPPQITEGGLFKNGYNAELDELLDLVLQCTFARGILLYQVSATFVDDQQVVVFVENVFDCEHGSRRIIRVRK